MFCQQITKNSSVLAYAFWSLCQRLNSEKNVNGRYTSIQLIWSSSNVIHFKLFSSYFDPESSFSVTLYHLVVIRCRTRKVLHTSSGRVCCSMCTRVFCLHLSVLWKFIELLNHNYFLCSCVHVYIIDFLNSLFIFPLYLELIESFNKCWEACNTGFIKR